MPTYEYQCQLCNYTFEIKQSFAEYKELKKCPQCKKNKLKQVLCPVHSYVHQAPTTLQAQAEKNTKKMGKYELADRRRKDQLETRIQRKKPLIEKGLIPEDSITREPIEPWYGTLDKKKAKNILQDKEKIKNYIQKGT